jgi:hypothetical protein
MVPYDFGMVLAKLSLFAGYCFVFMCKELQVL